MITEPNSFRLPGQTPGGVMPGGLVNHKLTGDRVSLSPSFDFELRDGFRVLKLR